jgi:hypothetical protein
MHVFDHVYDPRFLPPESEAEADELGTEDMRLAVMSYIAMKMAESDEGKLKDDNIWFDLKLGAPFSEVEEIVEAAYKYTDVSDDDEEIDDVMQNIYTAGMLEQRKRDGYECSKCGIPLSVFEMNAKEDSEELTQCPNPDCKEDFQPPEPPPGTEMFECPSCHQDIAHTQNYCIECGARIDWSLPQGSVHTETETVTEYVDDGYGYGGYDYAWGGYYGYSPYGYYDPYDPFVDMLAFGVLCAVIF